MARTRLRQRLQAWEKRLFAAFEAACNDALKQAPDEELIALLDAYDDERNVKAMTDQELDEYLLALTKSKPGVTEPTPPPAGNVLAYIGEYVEGLEKGGAPTIAWHIRDRLKGLV